MATQRITASNTETITLRDGRRVTVREYPSNYIRIVVDGHQGKKYALTECFFSGTGMDAIFKLESL